MPKGYVTEAEVRFRIAQALELSPRMTIGMLQAFLTSRVSHNVRDVVLGLMVKEGSIRLEDRHFRSFRGHGSIARVVSLVDRKSTVSAEVSSGKGA